MWKVFDHDQYRESIIHFLSDVTKILPLNPSQIKYLKFNYKIKL